MKNNNQAKIYSLLLLLITLNVLAEKEYLDAEGRPFYDQDHLVCYDAINDEGLPRNILISLALHADVTSRAFNGNGRSTPLADSSTGGAFQIKDVFLIARLSNQGLLHIGTPPLPPTPEFGSLTSQQYLNFISNTFVRFGLSRRSLDADITSMYQCCLPYFEQAILRTGFTVPIKYKHQSIALSFDGGKLYQTGFIPIVDPRESTMTLFFKDFIGIEDFFIRAVLRPKGLIFNKTQTKIGFGDLCLFAILDVADCQEYLDGLQFGINLVLPTARKAKGNQLFELELGNGGGVLVDLFTNALITSDSDYFNPTIQLGGEFGAGRFRSMQRIPQIKTQSVEALLTSNPTLQVPIYREYRTYPFSELDSLVPMFADNASSVLMQQGAKLFVGFGNYFYNLFNTSSRLGIFYDYLRKGANKIFDVPATFDTQSVTALTKSSAHRIGWHLNFNTSSGFNCEFGSQHIIAGSNVPQLNELFFVWSVVF
jgi:hypothetical protein